MTEEVEVKKKGRPKGSKNKHPKPEFDPRKWFKCVKCEGVFRNNNTIGHCGACCRTFSGVGAFDAHRQGEHGVNRHCADPATLPEYRKMWIDDEGIWHAGERFDKDSLNKFLATVKDD